MFPSRNNNKIFKQCIPIFQNVGQDIVGLGVKGAWLKGPESKRPESKGPDQRGLSQRGLNPKGRHLYRGNHKVPDPSKSQTHRKLNVPDLFLSKKVGYFEDMNS